MEKMARLRCSASTSLNWEEGCLYFSFYSVQDCNLGQNGWKIKTTPPPISMMEKMARFPCSASTSLNWGEGWFYFSFYSVQDCSLALTRFYSIRESSTTNVWNVWNVIEIESVNLGHFLFMSRLMPFCGLILPQGSCDLFFLDLKREARALFLLGAGFHTNKIILLYHNRDVFTAAFK